MILHRASSSPLMFSQYRRRGGSIGGMHAVTQSEGEGEALVVEGVRQGYVDVGCSDLGRFAIRSKAICWDNCQTLFLTSVVMWEQILGSHEGRKREYEFINADFNWMMEKRVALVDYGVRIRATKLSQHSPDSWYWYLVELHSFFLQADSLNDGAELDQGWLNIINFPVLVGRGACNHGQSTKSATRELTE